MPFVGNTSGGGFRRKQPPATQSSSPDSREAASYTNTDNSHEQGPRNEEGLPLLDGHHTSSRPQRSSGSSNSVIVSPSVRALAALSGSPLPISLQQVEVEATRRRSSLPRSRLRSPSNGLDSSKRSTYPSGTAKTADLIEAFPEPLHQQVRSRCSVPARTSLFPALAALEERSPNVSETSPVRREYASDGSCSAQSMVRGINSAKSPSASNVWLSGALPNPSECDGSADTAISNSRPVRGEDVRYRYSGSPIYAVDTTSLHDMDQAEDVIMSATLGPAGSPTSGRTGATSFLSAVSQVGTALRNPEAVVNSSETQAQSRDENRVQQERAVANGALRFVSQSHSASTNTGVPQSFREEMIVPVTLTSHGRECSHEIAHLRGRRSFRMGVDGLQENRDGENEQSKRARYCLICRARRASRRVSKSAEHTRSNVFKKALASIFNHR
jgi:hypothetical protein